MKKIYAISLLRGISSTDLYESHSLGLNKRAKREHSSMSGDEDLAVVTCDDILSLYKKYASASLQIVEPDWQYSMLHVRMKLSEALNTEVEIGKSYSKFIKIVTNGEYTCKFTNEWGEENLDAIEFRKNDGRRKTLRNRDYGEEKYFTEIRDDFFSNKKNYIVDWFIPATAKWLEYAPDAKDFFWQKIMSMNEAHHLGLSRRAKEKFSKEDHEDAMALTEDDLVKLYDKYGEVTTEFQSIKNAKTWYDKIAIYDKIKDSLLSSSAS